MAPLKILNKLARLRRLERLLRFVWGAARVAAVALVLLALCCLADWLIDRWYDTPTALRVAFLWTQLLVVAALAVLLVVLPTFRRLGDSTLATWVERTFPDFRHRLITAVELNRAGADTKGMSPALIAAVTREAEQKAAATNFDGAADWRRLNRSAYVLLPVLAVGLLLVALAPRTVAELLARQLLLPVEITRSLRFELHDVTTLPTKELAGRDESRPPHRDIDTPAVCAGGDAVAIRFAAGGKASKDTTGTLRIRPDGGPPEDVAIKWEGELPDGRALFVAKVPTSPAPFTYKAWLGDARMRSEGRVTFEARPTVEAQKAVVQLPAYCGLRSDGRRFEEPQAKGDVLAMSGSTAAVTVTVSKPIRRAALEVLGPSQAGAPEQVLFTVGMTQTAGGTGATARFDVDPRQTAYRVLVWDDFGFANRVVPRRSVAMLPDEPPLVALLPERLGSTEDNEVEGVPIVFGKRMAVAYQASSPAGLYSARLRYRIVRNQDAGAGEFQTLPLTEYVGSPDVGPFDLSRGLFEKILDEDYQARVEFHAVPAPDPDAAPGRRKGGGRVIFETAKLPDLQLGDRIEFYVEVLDARPAHLAGRSEARIKEVVTEKQLAQWYKQKYRENEKLQELAKRQGGLFDKPEPPDKE